MRIYDYIQNQEIADCILAIATRPRCFSGGTLAAKATANPDLKTTTTINFMINGILYAKAAAATIDLSACTAGVEATAGTGVQAAGKYAAYLLTLDADGNFDALKGADADSAALALKALPAAPAGKAPCGILVVTNTTNAFIVGTTNSDAAGVTFTCYDLFDTFNGLGSVYKDAIAQ
jgi:hypothetical protein